MYTKQFPVRNQADYQKVECPLQKLNTSGSFYVSRYDTGTEEYSRIPAVKEKIFNTVEENLSISLIAVEYALKVSHATAFKALHAGRINLYSLQREQSTISEDYLSCFTALAYNRLHKIKSSLQMFYSLMKVPLENWDV